MSGSRNFTSLPHAIRADDHQAFQPRDAFIDIDFPRLADQVTEVFKCSFEEVPVW